MLKHYKIMTAMIALGEFTVDDLVKICDAKIDTVRSVLSQKKQFIESLGDNLKDKLRGRVVEQFRLDPTQLDRLCNEVDILYKQISNVSKNHLDYSSTAPKIPLGLLIAEDILFRRILKNCNSGNKKELLKIAILNFETANSEWKNMGAGACFDQKFESINKRFKSVSDSIDSYQMTICSG